MKPSYSYINISNPLLKIGGNYDWQYSIIPHKVYYKTSISARCWYIYYEPTTKYIYSLGKGGAIANEHGTYDSIDDAIRIPIVDEYANWNFATSIDTKRPQYCYTFSGGNETTPPTSETISPKAGIEFNDMTSWNVYDETTQDYIATIIVICGENYPVHLPGVSGVNETYYHWFVYSRDGGNTWKTCYMPYDETGSTNKIPYVAQKYPPVMYWNKETNNWTTTVQSLHGVYYDEEHNKLIFVCYNCVNENETLYDNTITKTWYCIGDYNYASDTWNFKYYMFDALLYNCFVRRFNGHFVAWNIGDQKAICIGEWNNDYTNINWNLIKPEGVKARRNMETLGKFEIYSIIYYPPTDKLVISALDEIINYDFIPDTTHPGLYTLGFRSRSTLNAFIKISHFIYNDKTGTILGIGDDRIQISYDGLHFECIAMVPDVITNNTSNYFRGGCLYNDNNYIISTNQWTTQYVNYNKLFSFGLRSDLALENGANMYKVGSVYTTTIKDEHPTVGTWIFIGQIALETLANGEHTVYYYMRTA